METQQRPGEIARPLSILLGKADELFPRRFHRPGLAAFDRIQPTVACLEGSQDFL